LRTSKSYRILIKLMAVINKADNIADSVTTLSDFLEPIFRNRDPFCTVSEELDYIRNYIKIMNYRYIGKFQYRIEVPQEYMQYRIIRFMLQPIVENSLTHGLINRPKGTVTLTAWSEGEDCFMQVEDDGQGMSPVVLTDLCALMESASLLEGPNHQGQGIGLANVNRRIRLQFGDAYGVSVESIEDQGTKVRLKVPIVRKS
jgi:two-component system sensor histidine kinase YesM